MTLGLQAGVQNLPFIPVLGLLGSDYLKYRSDLKTVKDPYTGKEYIAYPAIIPDISLIHAYKGDRFGGLTTHAYREDRLVAMAAKKTIAVVEELVEPDEVVPGLYEIYVSPFHIDAVVVAPGGAHPTACPGKYETDYKHLDEYVAASKDEASFQEYLAKYEPKIANIELNGFVTFFDKKEKIEELIKAWGKDKKLDKDIMELVINAILSKCNIEALILAREVNLPPPLPMPKVNVKQ